MPTQTLVKNRSKAFQKQNGRCFYCGCIMWVKDKEDFAVKNGISDPEAKRYQCTAEHLQARCDGGKNCSKNIVAACLFCNQSRHRRKTPQAPVEFKEYINKRLRKGKWPPQSLHHLFVI